MYKLTLALFASSLLGSTMSAATVYVTPEITAVLNPDFTQAVPLPSGNELPPRPGSFYVLQVDVNVRTEGLDGSAVGFFNTAFNSKIFGKGGSLLTDSRIAINPWNPDNPLIDANGPAPGGLVAKWYLNQDDGADRYDLQGIVFAAAVQSIDPIWDTRPLVTQGAGDHAGVFYLKLPGEYKSSVYADLLAVFGAGTYDAYGVPSTVGNTAIGGGVSMTVVPEPSAIALLLMLTGAVATGLAANGAFVRRDKSDSL